MSQNGLGLNNVLYIAVLLAALTYEPDSELHLLLVEEPEAHLHPQMQDLLLRFLQKEVGARSDVQVVVTTHSPNFASAARVERITSMSRRASGIAPRSIERFGMVPDELDHLARFLDVTKAALLFARAVILVEGVAEQLVLPLLAGELNPPRSMAESGVTVVNVGGLAFGPFAALYDDDRLPHRCAIISDSDPPKARDETKQDLENDAANAPAAAKPAEDLEPDPVLSATAQKLRASENARRKVFLSSKTFEYDLVLEGNWAWAIAALRLVKPLVTRRLENDAALSSPEARAAAILDAVEGVKGRFAQALTKTMPGVKAAGHQIVVPGYMRQGIEWACEMGHPPGASGSRPAPAAETAAPGQAEPRDRPL
jgi:putative ATP-dependent endonuclease of OLD family